MRPDPRHVASRARFARQGPRSASHGPDPGVRGRRGLDRLGSHGQRPAVARARGPRRARGHRSRRAALRALAGTGGDRIVAFLAGPSELRAKIPGVRRVAILRSASIGLVALAVLGLDLARPPEAQWGAKVLLGAIDLYQATLSRALGATGARCRFEPTCSHYGEAVIRRHGALKGTGLALARIARCGPWTRPGTVDPPP
ncbi:MAG: membrane protein insertion efficiency factor YidD [bacterium]|nr:membrane protein insertion efficiency factor YidD [bacterium]